LKEKDPETLRWTGGECIRQPPKTVKRNMTKTKKKRTNKLTKTKTRRKKSEKVKKIIY